MLIFRGETSHFFRPPPKKKKKIIKTPRSSPNMCCFTKKNPGHFFPSNKNPPRLAWRLASFSAATRRAWRDFWMVQTEGSSLSPKKSHLRIQMYIWGFAKMMVPNKRKFNSSPLKIGLLQKERIIFQAPFFRGELLNFGGVYGLLYLRMHEWVIFSKKKNING